MNHEIISSNFHENIDCISACLINETRGGHTLRASILNRIMLLQIQEKVRNDQMMMIKTKTYWTVS